MDTSVSSGFVPGDYSLVGKNAKTAVQKGLADAKWYTTPVARTKMRELLERRDGPAVRDTLIWFGLLFLFGGAGFLLWGTPWAVLPFALYGVIFASTSDSRWHETSHGTAFKTDWMNNVLYEIASFMVLRESTLWRWSHTRHHSDTIITGLDPEISVQRPVDILKLILGFFNVFAAQKFFTGIFMHLTGRFSAEECTYVPESARRGIVVRAWIYLLIFLGVIGLALATRSLLPLMYIGFPTFYGAWLMVVYGMTQHAGLAENVLDHRLNCRTVYMNPINRYLYWNMNYHVEHHMFPLVPYHALPKLHELVKFDMPPAYNGLVEAYREIIPTVMRQLKEPGYFIERPLPQREQRKRSTEPMREAATFSAAGKEILEGWIEVCPASALPAESIVRFDQDYATYAIYRTVDGKLYATDGKCTHGNAHLANGMLQGTLIECVKHNGRFDIRDGSPQRLPVCLGVKTYEVQEKEGRIFLRLESKQDSRSL